MNDMNDRLERRAARTARLAADEEPIIAELVAAVGVAVVSVYDFVGERIAPGEAIPILTRHLGIKHEPNVREGIIRALGIPTARDLAFKPLRDAYPLERDPTWQWVIANALAGMASFEEVADLPRIDQYEKLFPKRRRSSRPR
ncbi:MAG: hypothetical protein K2X38_20200 [Gemmataceae bacterium]|nr:hypothetical protein [Gemmataceae bacterium]